MICNLTGRPVILLVPDGEGRYFIKKEHPADLKNIAKVTMMPQPPERTVDGTPIYPSDRFTCLVRQIGGIGKDLAPDVERIVTSDVADAISDGVPVPPGSYLTPIDIVLRPQIWGIVGCPTGLFCLGLKKVAIPE